MSKFSSKFDEALYGLSLLGPDRFVSFDDGSSFSFIKGPLKMDGPFADFEPQHAEVLRREAGPRLEALAWIVHERSDGIVEVRDVTTRELLAEADALPWEYEEAE
jgi:hypothetical protein